MTERKKPKIPFVGLHAHSGYSMHDGYGNPKKHLEGAWENGLEAHAITEHGHCNGMTFQILHARKMAKEGREIKPILGVEAYFLPSVEQWKKEKAEYKEKLSESKDSDDARTLTPEIIKERYKSRIKERRHLVLLAATQEGLYNIFKMVSTSHTGDYYYYYPRIDYDLLEKYSEGVIATSACLGGIYADSYWKYRDEGEERVLEEMRKDTEKMLSIFGGRWYGEIQWNNIVDQHKVNKLVIKVCKEYGVDIISTADSHYPTADDFANRELYRRLKWLGGANLDEETGKITGMPDWYLDDDGELTPLPESRAEIDCELYPKNGDQMWEDYKRFSKECGFEYDDDLVMNSITKTHEIAFDIIEDVEPDCSVKLPSFVLENEEPNKALEEMVWSAFNKKFSEGFKYGAEKEYKERIERELGVITNRGFSEYFLTMKTISDKAQDLMLVGPGRGSACGSLVSYVLDITKIDPIRWNLLFSRFLRDDATDYPDIDYDVADRYFLTNTLIKEWGEDSVVPITNWNTLQPKSVIKDLAKYFGISFIEVNKVTKVMEAEAEPKIKDERGQKAGVLDPPATFEELRRHSPSLKEFLRKYPHVDKFVVALRGELRFKGRHAAGVVISDDIPSTMPLIRSSKIGDDELESRRKLGLEGEYTFQTPWSEGQRVRHLEPFGFIKFDLLGLDAVAIAQHAIYLILQNKGIENITISQIREWYDTHLHPDVIDFDDQKVWEEVFHDGKWVGIFQFTNSGAQSLCEAVKPKNLIDLTMITSIYRPGPLSAGVDEQIIDAKKNPDYITYPNDIIKEITSETYGFYIFQEQIALAAHKLGKNITLDEGNKLRKVLTKKGTGKKVEIKNKLKGKFIAGCVEKGMDTHDAEELWAKFEYFNEYGFNKSHALAYSSISFQCAWLLTYFPLEWSAALLTYTSEDDKQHYLSLIRELGIDFKSPDINKSEAGWQIKDGALLQPMDSIKGCGFKGMQEIFKHRPFKNIEDLLNNEKIDYRRANRRVFNALIKCGIMDSLIDERFENRKHFWEVVANNPRPKATKTITFEEKFERLIEETRGVEPFTLDEEIENIYQLLGTYPINKVVTPRQIQALKKVNIYSVGKYAEMCEAGNPPEFVWGVAKDFQIRYTRNNRPFGFVTFTDLNSTTSHVKIWGLKPKIHKVQKHRAYFFSHLDYSPKWGLSTKAKRLKEWKKLERENSSSS